MLRLLLLNMVALGREPSSGSHSMPPSLSFSTPQRTSVFRPYIPMLNGSSYPAGSKAPVSYPSALRAIDASNPANRTEPCGLVS